MSRLMVPLQLDVLLHRRAGGQFADCRMATPTTDGQRHRELWAEPFSELPEGRPAGAYLHWALPDALTHGSVDADGNHTFMAIPDRWLIVRTSPSPRRPGVRTTRRWILESDRGEVFDAEQWTESVRPPEGQTPLTALGHGDPAWAAYFDTTERRLAFFDDLLDVERGPVAYMVTGWHATNTHDPVADPRIRTRSALSERLSVLGWTVTGSRRNDLARTPPTGTLYHGAAVDLPWPAAGASDEVGGPPPAPSVRVVLASTPAEALATLLTAGDSSEDVRLLEAALIGALDELAQPDGRTRLDAVLHASGFVALPGGEAVERVEQPRPQDPPAVPPPVAPLTPPRELTARAFVAADRDRERLVGTSVLEELEAVVVRDDTPATPSGPVDVARTLPRFYRPADPVLLVEGARRSHKHGGDGRFLPDGRLACRMGSDTVETLGVLDPTEAGHRLTLRGEMLLDRSLADLGVPAECEGLLRELVLLDPGASAEAVATLGVERAASAGIRATLERRIRVEQTVWWGARERRADLGAIAEHSNLQGTVPSPVAIAPPRRPWTPVHLEWEAELLPSQQGSKAWALDEVDFAPTDVATAEPIVVGGRTLLTPAAAHIAARQAAQTMTAALRIGAAPPAGEGPQDERLEGPLASRVSEVLDAELANTIPGDGSDHLGLPEGLEGLDVLSGTLDPFHEDLRGYDPDGPRVALRAGFIRLRRLRLVDSFGQFVDLPVAPLVAASLRAPQSPGHGALPPRTTAAARLWLRYTEGTGGQAEASSAVSPVAGFLVPNHLEGALEIFDATGASRAVLRPNPDGSVSFEASPGVAATVGTAPAEILGNQVLAGLVQGLLDWGIVDARETTSDGEPREGALLGLLRLVDSARWSIDPHGHGAGGTLGSLVARPIAVLRARTWLELYENDERGLSDTVVPLRLGSVGTLQDGLYGAFVGDDYRALRVPSAAAELARDFGRGRGYLQPATRVADFHRDFTRDISPTGPGQHPVTHPFVVRDRPIDIRPGRPVELTLLMEPFGQVHATCGILPRKEIGMRREWLAAGLANLAPTFRFGPVLVDPVQVRLPVGRNPHGSWTWAHRVDETTWAERPVTPATGKTAQIGGSVTATEGWLRLSPREDEGGR